MQKAAAAEVDDDEDDSDASSSGKTFDYLLNMVLRTLTEEKVRFSDLYLGRLKLEIFYTGVAINAQVLTQEYSRPESV